MLSVVTPTADRPHAFALCERWMARQTRQPDEWIVADGGRRPVVCTQGQTHLHVAAPAGPANFASNLARGLAAARGAVIVFVEDDDWYAPTHLATIRAQIIPGVLAAGDDLQQYYHLPSRRWRTFDNRGASLCQTALTRAALPTFLDALARCQRAGSFGVDGGFWATLPTAAKHLQRTQTVVGIKGLPGQPGLGIGHRPQPAGAWHADPHLAQLRAWIGDDVEVYRALVQGVEVAS